MAASKIKLSGVPPYDGEYELPDAFTNRELHYIKQVSGVRAAEIPEASKAGDVGLLIALAAITLQRAGHADLNIDVLWEASGENFEAVEEEDPEEDDDRPPAKATSGGNERSSGAVASSSEPQTPSGDSGKNDGDDSQDDPSPTGLPGSATDAVSDPATLVN